MIAKALTKVEELIELLEPLMDQAKQIDAFTLGKYKREAKQNLHAYPWAGYIALGMIGVLEWDEGAIDDSYRNAIALRNNAESHAMYATSLQLIGKYEEAFIEAKIASDLVPENLTLLEDSIKYALFSGQLRIASELAEQYQLRSPAKPLKHRETIMNAVSIFDASEFSHKIVSHSNRVAFKFLRDKRVPYVKTRVETDSQDQYVMFYIDVDLDDDQVEALDEELGQVLFDEVPEFNPNKYWVGLANKIVKS